MHRNAVADLLRGLEAPERPLYRSILSAFHTSKSETRLRVSVRLRNKGTQLRSRISSRCTTHHRFHNSKFNNPYGLTLLNATVNVDECSNVTIIKQREQPAGEVRGELKLASVLGHNDLPTVLIIVLNWNLSLIHISEPT